MRAYAALRGATPVAESDVHVVAAAGSGSDASRRSSRFALSCHSITRNTCPFGSARWADAETVTRSPARTPPSGGTIENDPVPAPPYGAMRADATPDAATV